MSIGRLLRDATLLDPDRVAVVAEDTTWTYRALDDVASRFAKILESLDSGRESHVALVLPNVVEFTMAYFGAHYAGCTIVPLHSQLTVPELVYHFHDAEVRVVVTGPESLDRVVHAAAQVPGVRRIVLTGNRPSADCRVVLWQEVLDAIPLDTIANPDSHQTAVILYTSGTTGRSKGAELTHANLRWNAEYMARHFMPEGKDTVALGVLPLFHSFGQTVIQNATLVSGGTVVLLARFTPGATLDAIVRHGVTFFAGVPSMYLALGRHVGGPPEPFATVRRCISGGAPMPVEVLKDFEERSGVPVLEGYGLSETSPVAAQNRVSRRRKAGSIGVPLDGVDFRLVDAADRVISEVDVPGEIQIRGPIIMKGYWRRPDETAASIVDGWFRTGDIARRDADGDYFVVDRKKDLILRGGMNVYPREVEEVLYSHPAIAEVAVVGVPDQRLGEEVSAVAVLRHGTEATAEELLAFCQQRLARYKCPKRIRFVTELPRGPTGKVVRRLLQEEVVGGERSSSES